MHLYRFTDDFSYGHTRRKRRVWVLEYHLEVGAHLPKSVAFEFFNVFPLKDNLAFRRFVQSKDGSAESRLSASGFSDDTDSVPRFEFERNAVHRFQIHGVALYKALGNREILFQIVHDENIIVVGILFLVFCHRRVFGCNLFRFANVRRCSFNRFDFHVVLNADFFFSHTISPLSMQR